MPSIKTSTPILAGQYYHLFNRGTNRQKLFFSKDNYKYFLKLMDKFLSEYMSILAYCLLPNHFHIIVKINNCQEQNIELNKEIDSGKLAVRQLMKLFITYAMSVNVKEKRTGNLFAPKYKRLHITSDEYLKYLVFYTHYNPEKHGITGQFSSYTYSSFRAICSSKTTKVDRDLVLELFDGHDNFLNYHDIVHKERKELELE